MEDTTLKTIRTKFVSVRFRQFHSWFGFLDIVG